MYILDIIVAVILIIALVRGIKNGLVVEVMGIASIFIAGYAAYYLCDDIASFWKGSFSYKEELIFVLIFILVLVGIGFIARLLSRLFESVGLGVIDKIGGAVIAVLKYIIILSVALSLFMSINDTLGLVKREQVHSSVLFKPMTKITDYLFPYFKKAKDEITKIHNEYLNE